MTSIPRRCWQDVRAALASPSAVVVVMVLIMSSTAAIAFMPRHGDPQAIQAAPATRDQTSEFVRYWEAQPRVQVPVATEGASVVIVKFADFLCPPCAQTYMEYKGILAKYRALYPGEIKFITKDYPLEMECNANLQRDIHLAACEAAVAMRLARLKGRGDAMEDWLYTRNQALTPAIVRQGARDIGGVADFDEQYPTVINQVKSDIALATILGISGTPTFYIGHREPGSDTVMYIKPGILPPQIFELALQYELKKAGKIKP
jgi:hypothetical protein